MQTLLIQPDELTSQDCSIRNGTGANTPDNSGTLLVGTLRVLGADTYWRSLIRFDLTGLPIGATPSGFVITLAAGGGSPVPGGTYTACRITQPGWTEDATWNRHDGLNSWTMPGGDFTLTNAAVFVHPGGNVSLVFNAIEMLLDAIAEGLTYLDVLFTGPESPGASNYVACLSSAAAEANRPKGLVTYEAISLTVADNGDGSGATATITGSDVSDVHRVFVGRWGGGVGGVNFSHSASRTGDGTALLPLDPGHYWAMIDSLSNLVYFRVTDGEYSVHYRWLLAVQARIQSLALPGIANENIVVRKLPWVDIPEVYPSIIISGWIPESIANYSNVRESYGYPATISIQEKDNHDLITNQERNLLWRQRMMTAIVHQPEIASIPEISDAFIEPGPVVLPAAFSDQVYHSSFVARGTALLARGI